VSAKATPPPEEETSVPARQGIRESRADVTDANRGASKLIPGSRQPSGTEIEAGPSGDQFDHLIDRQLVGLDVFGKLW
jgi:hypothetical protein